MSRRILHLSDLHFGRERPELLDPLVGAVNELAPDLVVVSGDFTQRARHAQYRDAQAFMERLEPPTLSVPGNHDTPLDNLWVRLVRPWRRYKRYIDRELEPSFEDDEVAVVGVNTVNNWAWQRGRIGRHTVRRVCGAFEGHRGRRMHLAVLHHPLEHLPETDKRLMRGATRAVARLGECGADIVLCGHLHTWRAVPMTTQAGVLLVQAGTGLSTRHRNEPNDFNLLTCEGGRAVTVDRYTAPIGTPEYTHDSTAQFEKRDAEWRKVA